MSGEASLQAEYFIEQLKQLPGDKPGCLLWGGETTVTVKGSGKGGRNQEFALAAALALRGTKNIAVLAAGTDGTDGPTDAAGAIRGSLSVAPALEQGLNADEFLARNDSYSFFSQTGELLKTGPTGTNVMDLYAAFILSNSPE